MKTEWIIFDRTESILQSVTSDVFTCSFLALCIWFSHNQGGGWWTFFTCSLFLLVLGVKVSRLGPSRNKKLRSKKEAIKWANSLPED